MVFQCSKCKRKWQQPIGICPYCLIELDRIKSEKMETVVSSKVSISSLPHMKVPYFANIIKDEQGNLFAYKSTEKIDKIELKSNPESVAIFRIKYDIIEGLENIFKLLEVSLNENLKVLVIPTLISTNYTYFKENTSPELLESVLNFLLEKKISVKVGAQSFNEIPIEGLAQKSGLLDVCLKKGITPFDLSKAVFVKKEDLEISEEVLSADLVINLSMLKAEKVASTDNIFYVLKKENYSGLKYLQSEKEISEKLLKTLSNVITIGEADTVQRSNSTTTYLGLIFGGRNFLNVDAIFNKVIMARKLPEIIKDINVDSIAISGRSIMEVERDIEM
ncbi:MAG: DUF362 domain-containing protein [Candidatus Paceibacterota bacterium]|jgi:hypothetical protein